MSNNDDFSQNFITVQRHGKGGFCLAVGAVFCVLTCIIWFPLYWLFPDVQGQLHPLSALSSIAEIAIGTNLALSLVNSLQAYVERFSISRNPTFAESVSEELEAHTYSGIAISVSEFVSRFERHLNKELEEYETAIAALAKFVKIIGIVVALLFFLILCAQTLVIGVQIPWALAIYLCALAAMPLFIHAAGTYWFSIKFVRDIEGFRNGIDQDGPYAILAKRIIERFEEKSTMLKRINTSLG